MPRPMNDTDMLLVEDNPDDIAMIRRLVTMSHAPIRLSVCTDGRRALEYILRRNHPSASPALSVPQVVLLDIGLPGIDGLEVLRRLRTEEATRQLPVIMLTASQDEHYVREGQELGAHSYIVKPMKLHDFSWIARTIGNYRARVAKLASHSAQRGGEPCSNR